MAWILLTDDNSIIMNHYILKKKKISFEFFYRIHNHTIFSMEKLKFCSKKSSQNGELHYAVGHLNGNV